MKAQARVIFYGNSIVLAGLRASLETNPSFQLIEHPRPLSEQGLYELQPDVIIFDIADIQPDFHYILAQKLSGLQLIGIDPDSNQVLVWAGQQLQELSVRDLVGIIRQKGSNTSACDGEKNDGKPLCIQTS